ncbi:MAG TPA: hypothetical protein VFG62_12570 [Rhodopila sp.]|nr:hypothetical protein [Rhodopila sp.]
MGNINKTARILWVLAIASPIALAGCTPPTQPGATASAHYEEDVTAQVIAMNKAKRQLTLQGPRGGVAVFQVSDKVPNFDQINVGDTIKASYMERIDAVVQGSQSQPINGTIVQTATSGAAKGQQPFRTSMISAKQSVQIVSVDRTSHTITFRGPDGMFDSFVVENPQNYAFADGLQPGTIVDVTETAAIVLSLQKVS